VDEENDWSSEAWARCSAGAADERFPWCREKSREKRKSSGSGDASTGAWRAKQVQSEPEHKGNSLLQGKSQGIWQKVWDAGAKLKGHALESGARLPSRESGSPKSQQFSLVQGKKQGKRKNRLRRYPVPALGPVSVEIACRLERAARHCGRIRRNKTIGNQLVL
jgi:hypothetical protein